MWLFLLAALHRMQALSALACSVGCGFVAFASLKIALFYTTSQKGNDPKVMLLGRSLSISNCDLTPLLWENVFCLGYLVIFRLGNLFGKDNAVSMESLFNGYFVPILGYGHSGCSKQNFHFAVIAY